MQNICYCCDDCVILPYHRCGNTYERINQFGDLLLLIENKLYITIGHCDHSNLKIEEGGMFSYNLASTAKYYVGTSRNKYFLNNTHYHAVLKFNIIGDIPMDSLQITVYRELSNEEREKPDIITENLTIDIEELHKYLQDNDILINYDTSFQKSPIPCDFINKHLYGFTIVHNFSNGNRTNIVIRKNIAVKPATKN